ncbi:type III-A CRISPR-associated protein Csm2 [Caminibacter mediatlanticus TB-2]|uniref:CRISPR system Cms protein Csm2 n=1 Tax=Caminibacter mediatlanticus TB-2 TaxID=391592 RepID=A0ABX5VAP0_9BACT|nr:type III-A CRISPR-associated protein Csm2 [Caminibacter mediatlanticus]QCT95333.1 type III-A CRISPR-associated protein Csm2 [Caminibacter mediatlanticus TB-2]
MADLIKWSKNNWKNLDKDFIFDLGNITEKTFDVTAQKWALVIANQGRGVEKNQLRNFYDKVLELYQKSVNMEKEEYKTKLLPFIKMLRSKVYYAKNKENGKVNDAFVEFMEYSLNQIDEDKKKFENFKYLFEAIMGFYMKEKIIKLYFNRKTKKQVIDCKKSLIFLEETFKNYECKEN